MSTSKTELFGCLLMGLKEFIEQDKEYPYPDLLRHGMNGLSQEMKSSVAFPKTMTGLLRLLSESPKDFCKSNFIPKEYDRDFGLIDEGSLSEEANEYLTELLSNGVNEYGSAIAKQLAIENSQFARIIGKLRDAHDNIDPKQAQREYLLLRPFVIQNEFTTLDKIRKTFRRVKHLSIEEIGALYEECPENQNYWYCDRCGILTEKNGRLKGLKPSLCSNHRRNSSFVHKVEWQPGLLQVKDGIQQRVCFPGIPEMNLYSFIEKLQQEHSDYLREVNLYPAIDRYDLQLRFSDDAVWAIDIKDVRNPYRLAKNLGKLDDEGSLHYDESFYVISDRCIKNKPNYIKTARKEATRLPKTTHLLSEKVFRTKVSEKIAELQEE